MTEHLQVLHIVSPAPSERLDVIVFELPPCSAVRAAPPSARLHGLKLSPGYTIAVLCFARSPIKAASSVIARICGELHQKRSAARWVFLSLAPIVFPLPIAIGCSPPSSIFPCTLGICGPASPVSFILSFSIRLLPPPRPRFSLFWIVFAPFFQLDKLGRHIRGIATSLSCLISSTFFSLTFSAGAILNISFCDMLTLAQPSSEIPQKTTRPCFSPRNERK